MKRFIKSLLLRLLIAIIEIVGSVISLFMCPIGVIGRCIISWVIAPIAWVIFGNQAYNYLTEKIGISAFIDEFGFACVFNDDFPIEYWHLNVIAKLKEYHYYNYDKEYLKRLDFEKKEQDRKEQYEKDKLHYRKFIEEKREEILMKMFPYADIREISSSYLETLELMGTLPRLPY